MSNVRVRVGILVGDLEMVSQFLLAAQFAGFDRRLMIHRIFGEGPFGESRRQGGRLRQRQDTVPHSLGVEVYRTSRSVI